jgi:predicted  nucleic acid-binding Zn-ribbon protein
MGSSFSSNKKKYYSNGSSERLLSEDDPYSNNNSSSSGNLNVQLEAIKFQLNKFKEENQKLKVEIKSLYEKTSKMESDINKIQNNHGNEIYALNQNVLSVQKDIVTLMNNQKIISEVLQNNSMNNYDSLKV